MSEVPLYSLAYAKWGDAIFFSHLDTLRIFERAVRRTGLAVCFTRGCNPHIRLSFYKALPVGVAVDGEWFSMKFARQLEPDRLVEHLNDQLPEGFSILEAVRGKPPRKGDEAPELHLHFSGTREGAEAAMASLLSRERIEIEAPEKSGESRRDVRPFFKDYEVGEGVIRCRFQNQEDRKPRIRDLARALYSLGREGPVEVDLVRVARPADSAGTDGLPFPS